MVGAFFDDFADDFAVGAFAVDDFADAFSIPPAPAPKAASSELHVEELPYDAPFSEENKTPFGEVEGRFGDDDPVFLEEPV